MAQAGEITLLLQQAERGESGASDQLFRLVESDLKAIARKRKRSAPAGHEASTTLLVDEAFMRLVGRDASKWEPGDRRKFFGFASNKIHDMLLKAARAQQTAKRGGGRKQVEHEDEVVAADRGGAVNDVDALIDLKDALDRFERFAADDALCFRLRFFLGSTFEESAQVIGVSVTEAKRGYERARLWLANELKEYALDA